MQMFCVIMGLPYYKYISNLKYNKKNIVYLADDVVLLIACLLNTHGVLGLMSGRDQDQVTGTCLLIPGHGRWS